MVGRVVAGVQASADAFQHGVARIIRFAGSTVLEQVVPATTSENHPENQ